MDEKFEEFINQAFDSKKREELLESRYSVCRMLINAWLLFMLVHMLNDVIIHSQWVSLGTLAASVASLGFAVSSASDIKILLLAKHLQENEDGSSNKMDSSMVDEPNSENVTD